MRTGPGDACANAFPHERSPRTGVRSRRSSPTASRSCSSTRCSSSFPASGSSPARRSPSRTARATFPGNPIMPGVKMVEALAQCGAVAVLSQPENRGRLVLFAGIDDVRFKRIVRPGEVLDLVCDVEAVRGPVGRGKVRASVDGELARARHADLRGERGVIGRTNGRPVSITGLGCHVPGARADERRAVASSSTPPTSGSATAPGSASAGSLPRARRSPTSRSRRRGEALAMAGVEPTSLDLLIVATVTPDMTFPSTAALVADALGCRRRGRLRPLGRLYRVHVRARPGARRCSPRASRSARSSSAATSSRRSSTGPTARRSSSSATARARSCSSGVDEGGFLGFELGADGGGGPEAAAAEQRLAALRGLGDASCKMNGREVFKFATRVMVCSAEEILDGVREDRRRRRRLRPASGERPDHRPRGQEARIPR